MKIAIVGATGFLGKEIARQLIISDHQIVGVTRSAGKVESVFGGKAEEFLWDGKNSDALLPLINRVDVVINLAGEDIGRKRWTEKRKRLILESRTGPARAIAGAIRKAGRKPSQWIQASAVGIYGSDFDGTGSKSAESVGFLPLVCREWEKPARDLEIDDVSVAITRIGVVLGTESGMLKKVLPLFRAFLGGHLGNGRQWLSWVHKNDLATAIEFIIANRLAGTYDITSPEPAVQKQFFKTLGKTLKRPSRAHVPAFVLKAVFGEMAEATILASLRVMPDQLLEKGFSFKYPRLKEALDELINTHR